MRRLSDLASRSSCFRVSFSIYKYIQKDILVLTIKNSKYEIYK